MNWQGLVSILLLSLQFGMQPFLTTQFLDRKAIKSVVVIVQEIVKIVICILFLLVTGQVKSVISSWDLKKSMEVACLPAFIYSIQNVLAFIAYDQLDPLAYNLINQSKIIFAAIFLVLLLNKYQTKRQLIGLMLLFIVSVMLSMDEYKASSSSALNKNKLHHDHKDTTLGLICIVIASAMSGLAGVLVQKSLQGLNKDTSNNNNKPSGPRNSLLLTIELGVYSIIFMYIRLLFEIKFNILDGQLVSQHSYLYHLNLKGLIPITVNALGGICVGLVTKYAGVIHKSYALILGILITGITRAFFYNQNTMTTSMYIGVPLVMISLWLNNPTTPSAPIIKDKKKEL